MFHFSITHSPLIAGEIEFLACQLVTINLNESSLQIQLPFGQRLHTLRRCMQSFVKIHQAGDSCARIHRSVWSHGVLQTEIFRAKINDKSPVNIFRHESTHLMSVRCCSDKPVIRQSSGTNSMSSLAPPLSDFSFAFETRSG